MSKTLKRQNVTGYGTYTVRNICLANEAYGKHGHLIDNDSPFLLGEILYNGKTVFVFNMSVDNPNANRWDDQISLNGIVSVLEIN